MINSLERVDGIWGPPGDLEIEAVVTYSEAPIPTTGEPGWIWWANGKTGYESTCRGAQKAAEKALHRGT